MVINQSENEKKRKAPDWLIDNIAEASRNARKIYFLYIGFLAYCALTVVSTTDRQIILNETARLPIINLEVSLNGFFILAPLLAIFAFAYLQLYLQRLKGLITDLRTKYAPVEKRRLYPWMLNIAEDPEPGVIGRLQRSVVAFSLWWSLPIVLILFAFWFVRKHDPLWCYVVGLLPILGTSIVIWFWCRYRLVQVRGIIPNIGGKVSLALIVLLFEVFLLSLVIPKALRGDIRRHEFLWSWTCVDLSFQKLVTEPSVEYQTIYSVDLREAHLEGADLTAAVLKHADLRGAHLQKSRMSFAILEEANLREANLQGAELEGASLQQAKLQRANLGGAVLFEANLQETYLGEADLTEANITGANLQGAYLGSAVLTGAKLKEANLRRAELTEALLEGADLSGANLKEAKLEKADLQAARLNGAVLRATNLRFTNLQGANLSEADLSRADLEGANLQEADLRAAKNLTFEQLSEVKTLYGAKLDSTLMEQIRKDYPHLLEKPKPDE